MGEALLAAKTSRVNLRVLILGACLSLPLLAVLFLNIGRDPAAIRSPLVGRSAPQFSLARAGGGAPVSLDSLRGRPVVLNFWATWCAPCVQEHEALAEAARSSPGVQFVGIVYQDDEARTVGFLAANGAAYPSLVDPEGKAAIGYGVSGIPETFFIDAAGIVVEKHVGPLDPETLASLLAQTRGAP